MQDELFNIPLVVYWGWLVPLLFGTIFFTSYAIEKRRLSNGIWFSLFFYSTMVMLAISIIGFGNELLFGFSLIIFIGIILLIGLAFTLQAFLLLWNAWIVWRRESHTIANMLTLFLGIAILLAPFIMRLTSLYLPLLVATFVNIFPGMVIFYVLFWFYNYLTMLVIYQFNHPRYRQDYLIVLGAGLLNGDEVSPLLARRIDRALKFYRKQLRKIGQGPVIIFSGGQGGDETVAEGVAMRQYALDHGLPPEQAIAEDQSTTTYENMVFSQKIIDARGTVKPKITFVTNGYHTFRAGMIARKAGVKANGIGAHTAKFFLPNAIIREYIAIFVGNKRWHAIAIGLMFILSLVLVWAEYR
ncbi:YdcF family protein [Levilactobacillus tujiorum]|uniref:YdcF family protein n=1 Tax=Levilactobacillus tujiorum TaxID=2912243 RepID=A0ABX1L586_9LACO|nr:YdcF family protein [Levilactobacillus tujiorum]MCH5464064.1 YdcF family protein [Levilactobacillus tujiorum]NLR11164.1 YdcF family protein [Lactobacillus sp. HBUAS51387]NLR29047.1 YdcF family protein [Levilactobacillus tujiorum]